MRNKTIISFLFLLFSRVGFSQNEIPLEEVLLLARQHSLDYKENKNKFLSEYWEFKKFKLNQLPRIQFNVSPLTVNRSLTERYSFENNIETFRETKTISSSSGVNISQNIPITGGRISVSSHISRIENFGDSPFTSYGTTPIRISFSQPLFTHNSHRWEKLEVPLKLKNAESQLIQTTQVLNERVAQQYFGLLKEFQVYELALQEVYNSDTLYQSGLTLLTINRITPNQLVDLDLKRTNANIFLTKQKQKLSDAIFQIDKLLNGNWPNGGIPVIDNEVPGIKIDPSELVELAKQNNPFYIQINQERINLEKDIDRAKKQNKFSTSLSFSYGLNQGGKTIQEAFYSHLNNKPDLCPYQFR